MKRIFATLAAINGTALLACAGLGWWSAHQGQAASEDNIYLAHFGSGLAASILTLLVHCIVFTYFLGTGRWVKEVKYAYHLPDEPWPRLTRDLKRRTFPFALAAMLITIAAAASGAGRQLQEWPWQVHTALAMASLGINLLVFVLEYRNISINGRAIDAVTALVEEIRASHQLVPSAMALRDDRPREQDMP
jgi:hypothetical protein